MRVDEQVPRLFIRNCCAKQLPVGLSIILVSSVKGHTVFLFDCRVECGLHVLNVLWNEAGVKEFVVVQIVQQAPSCSIAVIQHGVGRVGYGVDT